MYEKQHNLKQAYAYAYVGRLMSAIDMVEL